MIHRRIGIDTSVLVRLVTGLPPEAYSYCVEQLNALTGSGAEIVVSNQVIGETYVTVQHHYGATRKDAQAEIRNVFRSGLVAPLNGRAVIEALNASGGPGLFDRTHHQRLLPRRVGDADFGSADGLPARRAAPPGYR